MHDIICVIPTYNYALNLYVTLYTILPPTITSFYHLLRSYTFSPGVQAFILDETVFSKCSHPVYCTFSVKVCWASSSHQGFLRIAGVWSALTSHVFSKHPLCRMLSVRVEVSSMVLSNFDDGSRMRKATYFCTVDIWHFRPKL